MPAQDAYQRQKFNDPAQAAPRAPMDRPVTRTPAAVLGGRPQTAQKPFSDFVTLSDFSGPQDPANADPGTVVTPNYANPSNPYEGDQHGIDPPPSHFDLTTLLKRRF